MKQELLPFREHMCPPRFLFGVRVDHLFSLLCCVVFFFCLSSLCVFYAQCCQRLECPFGFLLLLFPVIIYISADMSIPNVPLLFIENKLYSHHWRLTHCIEISTTAMKVSSRVCVLNRGIYFIPFKTIFLLDFVNFPTV